MFAMRTKDPNQRLVRVFQSKEAMFAIVTEEESVFFQGTSYKVTIIQWKNEIR